MASVSSFETELLKIIALVDEEFYHSEDWIKVQALGLAVIGVGFVLWATYVFFRDVLFGGFSFELTLVTLSLVIATNALAFSFVFGLDYPARLRRVRAETHFNKLTKKVPDTLILAALIRMKASLPLTVTLKSVYQRDNSVFSLESLVRRALEPLK